MRGTTTDRPSALLAVVACALVVCSALAVVPGGADAEQHLSGDITFDEGDGELRVVVENASSGNFSGGNESVTIDIGGEQIERGPNALEGGEYTYTVSQERLADIFRGQSGSDTPVTVSHGGSELFNRTVDIRRITLGSNGEFGENGELRFGVGTTFGIEDGADVPIQVRGQNTTATYTNTSGPSLAVSRNTLSDLGVLRDPGQLTVSGGEAYVRDEIEFNTKTAAGPVTAVRVNSSVRFESLLFENGETYVVNVTSGEGKYIRTISANGQDIDVNSAALAAEDSLTLTVRHDGTGTQIVSETVEFDRTSVTGNVTGPVVTFDSTLDVEAENATENATVWVRNGSIINRSEATLNTSTQNLTLSDPGVLPGSQGQTAGLLIQFEGEPSPVYATVTRQDDLSAAGPPGSNMGPIATLFTFLGNNLLLAIVSILGVVVVGGVVYVALSFLDSDGTGLNLLGSSSNSTSSNEAPAAETATVSFEVVDELAGRTYREADEVIARQGNGTQSGLGSGGGVGSSGGRNAGRNTGRNTGPSGGLGGINTNSDERIGLSAGEGDRDLSYGNWTFEVIEKNQTVGRGQKEIRYGSGITHVPLSVDPYTVEVQVTDGPDRAPAKRAEVTVTADVERWQGRKRTNPDGKVKFEIPRSASRVTFTAETGTAQPVESDYRIDRAVQNGVTLAVGAETGGMAIETKVGQRAWPGVDVQITPISEDAKAYTPEETATITMNSEGQRNAQNLPTGEYEVSAHPQIEGVETTAAVEPVTVRNDATEDVTLSIGVSYSIPETYRSQLTDLRGRVEELTAATNRDVAIPRYYGTVLASVLGLVETVESSPERVVGADISPDRMVEAVLEATEAGITAVEGAMSERRTSSLLEACASMPPAEVDWSGEATLDAFLSQEAEGSERGRRALRDRLEETDDVLDEKWGEVNEIAPARKLHDRVGELARETGGIDDELTVVARAYVGICLLDAIEGLFEHDALRERLNSGSY